MQYTKIKLLDGHIIIFIGLLQCGQQYSVQLVSVLKLMVTVSVMVTVTLLLQGQISCLESDAMIIQNLQSGTIITDPAFMCIYYTTYTLNYTTVTTHKLQYTTVTTIHYQYPILYTTVTTVHFPYTIVYYLDQNYRYLCQNTLPLHYTTL